MTHNFLNAVNFAEWQQIATLLLEEVNQGYLYTKLSASTCKLFALSSLSRFVNRSKATLHQHNALKIDILIILPCLVFRV